MQQSQDKPKDAKADLNADDETSSNKKTEAHNKADKKTTVSPQVKQADQAEEKTKSSSVKNASLNSSAKAPVQKTTSKLALLNFVLLILLLSIFGYFSYLLYAGGNLDFLIPKSAKSQTQVALIDKLNAKILAQDAQISTQDAQIQAQKQTLSKLNKSDARQNSALADVLNKVAAAAKVQSDDWRLAEVEYLLRLASQELILAQDTNSSLRLMQAAYTRLDNLSLAAALPVLKALKSDISNLTLLEAKGGKNISIELLALSQSVANLTQERKFLQNSTSEKISESPDTLGEKFLAKLKSLVVIKRHSNMPVPLLTQEAIVLEKQRILLLLNQASWASLRKDNQLYKTSIEASLTILSANFTGNGQADLIVKKLQDLKNLNLTISTENYTKGLQKLEDFMLSRYNLPLANKSAQVQKANKGASVEKSSNNNATDEAKPKEAPANEAKPKEAPDATDEAKPKEPQPPTESEKTEEAEPTQAQKADKAPLEFRRV